MPKYAVFRKATYRVEVEAENEEDAQDVASDEGEIYADNNEIDVEWTVVEAPP